jgi:hypothetical protein
VPREIPLGFFIRCDTTNLATLVYIEDLVAKAVLEFG